MASLRAPTHRPMLNYFQQAPVRGQLEPLSADGYSRTGWRWLQCTDTPNELRVLLPPRTALIYAQLLKVEAAELAKQTQASWDIITQIRHLKDRMIRKCQRLARASLPQDRSAPRPRFITMHAPPDFRLKEMERWFRDYGSELLQNTAEVPLQSYGCRCEKCSPPTRAYVGTPPTAAATATATAPRRGTAASSAARPSSPGLHRRSLGSQGSQASRHASSQRKASKARAQPRQVPVRSPRTERRSSIARSPPPLPTPQRARSRSVSPYHGLRGQSPGRLAVMSPDPVPIPYRPSMENIREDEPIYAESPETMDHERLSESPERPLEHEPQHVSMPEPTPINYPPDQERVPFPSAGTPPLETIHEHDGQEQEAGPSQRPTLPRRRSSLKKSASKLSLNSQKSVTWAMDHAWEEQMSKYTKAIGEAEALGEGLENAREDYRNLVGEMRRLCRHVISATEKVRLESENLRHQEEIMRRQEDRIKECVSRLERMELQYREKVFNILEETKRVVKLVENVHEA